MKKNKSPIIAAIVAEPMAMKKSEMKKGEMEYPMDKGGHGGKDMPNGEPMMKKGKGYCPTCGKKM